MIFKKSTPHIRHVAIIMDGNGRWAQAKGWPRTMGHKVGAERVEEIIEKANDLKLEHISLFAFSTENWKRPKEEVDTLMDLLYEQLERQKPQFKKISLKFKAIGEIHRLPEKNQKQIREILEYTKDHTGMQLNLFLSYGSRLEITEAAKQMAQDFAAGKITLAEFNEADFSKYLLTREIPDPEIVIRTSGEFRISNFLLWQSAYTEFYILKKSWPQFHAKDLEAVCRSFGSRIRRFGATTEQVKELTQ